MSIGWNGTPAFNSDPHAGLLFLLLAALALLELLLAFERAGPAFAFGEPFVADGASAGVIGTLTLELC